MFQYFFNVYSRDVVVKMDTTSSDSKYDSDIDWIDNSDFKFIDHAEETILKNIYQIIFFILFLIFRFIKNPL